MEVQMHPSFGMISVNRASVSPPGSTLFDSDIRHRHTIILRIARADLHRELSRDWLFEREQLIEVEMSEAQWAGFVSSTNSSGVACTLSAINGERVERPPFVPRLEESMKETHKAAHRAFGAIEEALAQYEEKKTAENLRTLRAKIQNATANVDFAGQSLAEHAENVVQKARADIEAMMTQKAVQLGLESDGHSVKLLES